MGGNLQTGWSWTLRSKEKTILVNERTEVKLAYVDISSIDKFQRKIWSSKISNKVTV